MIREFQPNSHSWENWVYMLVDWKITVRDRILIKFDISDIPSDATIISANLYLYDYAHPTQDPSGRWHSIHELNQGCDWEETDGNLTWNEYEDQYNAGVGQIDEIQVGSPNEWLQRAKSNLIRAKQPKHEGVFWEDYCFDAQ